MMRAILVDTSAWIALMDTRDQYHRRAVEFGASLDRTTRRVITWGILAETYTWLRYHRGFAMAHRWLYEVGVAAAHRSIETIYPDPDIEPSIERELARYSDHDLSYVDAFSLAILRTRRDIDAIFAFDHHLGLGQVPVLPS